MRRISLLILISLMPLTACSSRDDNSTSNRPPTDITGGSAAFDVAFPNLTFDQPLWFGQAGDGSGKVYVVERPGLVLAFDSAGSTSTVDTFLDIRNRVTSASTEEGLLGLAFHPQYKSNHYFYVNYTAPNPLRTIISRFTASSSGKADRNSEQEVLAFNQPYANHNGGCLLFGPDGYLYIGTGDGGSAGDPQNNGQSKKTLLGKILRIDINQSSRGTNYGIPSDNPFVSASDGSRSEIFAYGLRNPWRFSFDSDTRRLWVADVGQNEIEEIDIVEKGKDYGWSIMEGNNCYKPKSNCDKTGLVMPIYQYTHQIGQCITGGYVYHGTKVPAMRGAYIFADFVAGKVWAMRYQDGQSPGVTELPQVPGIASFGLDANNELYATAFDGKVYRLMAK